MTFLDTTYLEQTVAYPIVNKKEAKKELMESEFNYWWWVEVSEDTTKEWIDKVFNYLFKRYKKGKKKGDYSISSWNTLVSGSLFTDEDWDYPQIEITVSKNYTQYNCYL